MSEPVLWDLDAHTGAKHRVLRAYLDAWIPVMAQQGLKVHARKSDAPRLLLVDGFAGPGRYATGEQGSPLIMLDALLSHSGFDRFGEVVFTFLFVEQDRRRVARLRAELAALGDLPSNVSIFVEEGAFETSAAGSLDPLSLHPDLDGGNGRSVFMPALPAGMVSFTVLLVILGDRLERCQRQRTKREDRRLQFLQATGQPPRRRHRCDKKHE